VVVTVGAETNVIPVAHAGVEREWTIPHDESPLTNMAAVILDGSSSSDPEGDPLTFAWNCQNGVVTTGKVSIVHLPAGTHTCTLTVKDSYGATKTATVDMKVNAEPNATPVANAGPDAAYTIPHDFDASTNRVRVVLDGTATVDADGDRMKHSWNCGNGNLATVELAADALMNTVGPDKTMPAKSGTWPGDGDDTMFLKGGTGAGAGDTFAGKWTHQENKVVVFLPAGENTCALTTVDTYGGSSTDSVVISVALEPNNAPSRL